MPARRFSAKDQTLRTRKRKRFLWRFVLWASLGVVVFFSLGIFSFASFWTLSDVFVEGADQMSMSKIRAHVETILSEPILGVFSGRNTLIFKRGLIERDIPQLFPKYGQVSVSHIGLTGLKVSVAPRVATAMVCTETCFFADENGFVFTEATGTQDFIRVVSTTTPVLGKNVFTSSVFKEMQFFVREMGLIELPISSVSFERDKTIYAFKAGGSLIIDNGTDRAHILDVLRAIMRDGSIGLGKPAFMAQLDYIEVGSGDKVIYRLKTGN